jgi:Uma2 family endonuclease
MADPQRRIKMTVEEFLEWNLSQDQRYELIDGVPVPLRTVAGAKAEHDAIVVNLIAELRDQLRGSSCSPRTADTAVRINIKRVRRPDVTIECAPVERGSLEARKPIAVFEVLSPTTRQLDHSEKLHEYLRHPTLMTIVLIDPAIMDVIVYTRGSDGSWDSVRLDWPADEIQVSGTTASLSLHGIYEGVPLATPRVDQDSTQ